MALAINHPENDQHWLYKKESFLQETVHYYLYKTSVTHRVQGTALRAASSFTLTKRTHAPKEEQREQVAKQ